MIIIVRVKTDVLEHGECRKVCEGDANTVKMWKYKFWVTPSIPPCVKAAVCVCCGRRRGEEPGPAAAPGREYRCGGGGVGDGFGEVHWFRCGQAGRWSAERARRTPPHTVSGDALKTEGCGGAEPRLLVSALPQRRSGSGSCSYFGAPARLF